MLVGLPLLGIALAGRPISPYLAFPPLTNVVTHAPFSWSVFVTLAVLVSGCLTPFLFCLLRNLPKPENALRRRPGLAWWAWPGIAVLGLAWWMAWNRFHWFEPFQEYTFTPIWIGYILSVNGLTQARTGRCMLSTRPGHLLGLFLLSAVFWWFFEYLNRFVQNWHYIGLEDLSPWGYFWQATLPFSTVLPAVLSTKECLASFPRLSAGLSRGPPIRVRAPKCLAALVLIAAGLALAGIGVWPERLYPLLWLSPLLVLVSLQAIYGEPTIFDPLADGNWRDLWLAALAALICGFLWELWNYKSLAHWEYSIPYVHRFQLFHMPMLGYAGYLPFGLACLAVARLLEPNARR
jgi:hypothetical protein